MTDLNAQNNPSNGGQQAPGYQPANVPPPAPPQQQYGAQTSSQQQYAAPQYGAQPQTPSYAAPVNDKWNTLAIIAFVLGLFGGSFGWIFGIIALRQIKKNGGKGKGLAIAGIVLLFVWIAIGFLLGILGVLSADETTAMALALAL